MKIFYIGLVIAISSIFLAGCMTNSREMVLENQQSLKIRSFQVKKYNKPKVIVARAVVSTLQDLSFIIDKADMMTGTVAATKLAKNASMRMTIIVRERGKGITEVRSNAQFSSLNQMPKAVTKPEFYNTFYSALDKSIFLESEGL